MVRSTVVHRGSDNLLYDFMYIARYTCTYTYIGYIFVTGIFMITSTVMFWIISMH